jgi:hypothetical protein
MSISNTSSTPLANISNISSNVKNQILSTDTTHILKKEKLLPANNTLNDKNIIIRNEEHDSTIAPTEELTDVNDHKEVDIITDFPIYHDMDEDTSSLSAAHEMLMEMEKRQETIYKLEKQLLNLQKRSDIFKAENEQMQSIHETNIKNFEIEKASIISEKEKQFEMEKNVLQTMHLNELQEKNAEIARLHEVLQEKDRKIQKGNDMRQMLQRRHTEMISQISNAHDAQLEQQSNAHLELLKEEKISHEKKVQEEIQKCENKAALNLSQELAKSMANNMEQMMLLDSEWKKKETILLNEIKDLKKFANEELEGEILSLEALHASTLEMERANSAELIEHAKIDSIQKYKLNIKTRLANAKYPNGCSSCTITFGTFDRKSHCRNCGLLVCSTCCVDKKCTLCRRDESKSALK